MVYRKGSLGETALGDWSHGFTNGRLLKGSGKARERKYTHAHALRGKWNNNTSATVKDRHAYASSNKNN